ncbi:MAG: DUF4407 domain-containing protein [Candidatus Marisimplicoccus sp.]
MSKFLGLDHFFFKEEDRNILYKISAIVFAILIISLLGLVYGFNLAFKDLFSSIFLSLFVLLFIYNFYRLIFSIIEGELDYNSDKLEIYKFIIKRSFVLILLSIFVSKSFQANIFEGIVENKLMEYKNELLSDYDKSLDKIYGEDIESVIVAYEEDIEYKLANKLTENDLIPLELERNSKIDSIQQIIEKERSEINYAISESNFFITRISIVSGKMPYSWIITILIVSLFLSPIYIFITNPVFRKYDVLCRKVNNKIILDHYDFFKKRYTELMKESTGIHIEYPEKYQDPPFNTLKIEPTYKYLKKGTLLKWFDKYD